MGMSRCVFVPDGSVDFIHADHVVNAILATTAHIATLPPSTFKIYHNASQAINRFLVYKFWDAAVEYLKFNPFEK
jgi:hypothetical protein